MQNKDWPNIAGLIEDGKADIAFIGAPMTLGCVTPSAYHKAPAVFRSALKRISTYDLEAGIDLDGTAVRDYGDVDCVHLNPAEGLAPILEAFRPLTQDHELAALIGGHNGVTRAGVTALDPSLQNIGLLTLDAHFDLRTTKDGPANGNPVRCLLADGLPGAHIVQIGIAPFANSREMHETALDAGISVSTMADCRTEGVVQTVAKGLQYLSAKCDVIYVDFDIDVIERALSPGAPGGRSGGFTPLEFFAATGLIGSHDEVKAVDLCEFDPDLDVSDITALIAGRWFAELLMGYQSR
ncbi:MAG: arginase family protein [Robiginitomaculum sp.]|nr:arginase family protein [Robiginitomaculum sp.]